MASWGDARQLLRLGELRQRRCERALFQTRQRLQAIEGEQHAFDEQQRSLKAFIASRYVQQQVLDRDQLMSLLRSQAVLRRQLQNLALDRLRVEEQHARLQGQWKTLQDQRQQLLRKQARYEAFGQRLNRERQMVLQLRDDNENEELLHIRNRQPVHEA
jgi:hypothetical protein